MKPTEPMSFFSNECAAHLELTRCSTSATSLPSVGKIAPIYSPQKKRTASQRTIPFVARGLEREEDEAEDVMMVESWGARVIDALLAATALIEPFLRDPMK